VEKLSFHNRAEILLNNSNKYWLRKHETKNSELFMLPQEEFHSFRNKYHRCKVSCVVALTLWRAVGDNHSQ